MIFFSGILTRIRTDLGVLYGLLLAPIIMTTKPHFSKNTAI